MSGSLNGSTSVSGKKFRTSSRTENLFSLFLLAFVGIFFTGGILVYKMEIAGKSDNDVLSYDKIQASFVMEEPKPQVKEPPKPAAPKKKAETSIPVDLTEKPPVIKEREIEEEQPQLREQPPPQEQRQVRQVYGLKKVYSQGLGAGGASQDAIVGKLGNTLNKDFDTLTASDDDLKGQPAAQPAASAASVTKYPKLKANFRNLKPQYSKEMLQNRVEGTVKARIMIGADGTVRRVEILSDLGHGSAEIAREFLMGLQFEPAMRGEQAVAVWIPFSIRFELI
ncbi:MAG: energy transducer TonB [Chitinispirillales bacterium]|jgi:TonB family protein|nr:energy transducer TonB [Chitinispirillales bacterium]